MSKRNKKQNVDAVNNEVKTEETNNVEGETEVKEKKGFFYGVGHAIGTAAGVVGKAVTSTPGKIITGAVVIGTAVIGGYEAGKHGFGSSEDTDEALTDEETYADVDSSTTESETEEN